MAERVDNRPVSTRIAAHYRDQITAGKLTPGTMLPSIKAISEEWGVSTATVEKALGKLRAENLVRGIHGVGTEVIGQLVSLSSGSQRQDRGRRTGSSWGVGERSGSHTAGITAAPGEVAAALGIGPGDRVIRRTRVYKDAHGIVAHSTSWLPEEFAQVVPELLAAKRLKGGTSLDLVSRATRREIVHRVDTRSARIATPEDLQLLGQEADTVAAILVLTSLFSDAQGRAIEYGVDLGAPGRTQTDASDRV